MTKPLRVNRANARQATTIALFLIWQAAAPATDWPQYRGPTTDGTTPDRMLTTWPASPTVVWRNASAPNGFSSVAVSQGRAFAMSLKDDGAGGYNECCVAIDAATGATLWTTPIDAAPYNWDPNGTDYGGAGITPNNTGDGSRTTPTVKDGRVFAFSGSLRLVCLNATNGSVLWNNDLQSSYGGSPPPQYDNCASPCLDDDLLFVNINTATNDQTLLALRTSDGGKAWSSQNENSTHATPIVTTIQGVRQVIFAATSGLVSLERNTGNFLWKFTYPFSPISTSMGASPVFYSNIVYCTTAYGRGAAAAQVVYTNNTWTVSQLYYKHEGPNPPLYYSSIWMTPVCFQGYIYSLAGNNGFTFLTAPLSCIELSTGVLKWTTPNFGMGGLILVNSNILALNETGQLILIQPDPSAYTELARFQAFQFTDSTPGKCWNSPSFSDGHIYARSTREIINVDVSPPPPLRLLTPTFLNSTQLQLVVSTANGTPIASNRMPQIEVRATNTLSAAASTWPKLTNRLVLGANGQARMTNTVTGQPRRFFMTVETP